jgi:hypothetical protein
VVRPTSAVGLGAPEEITGWDFDLTADQKLFRANAADHAELIATLMAGEAVASWAVYEAEAGVWTTACLS